jgi:DNA-binding FrmR family transcriptional regulator
VGASMSDEGDNVIVFPGQGGAGAPAAATGRELRALSERLHLLGCGLQAIAPHSQWTARQWMIASTQFRMRSSGTRGRLARVAGAAGLTRAIRCAVELGYACLETERALQAVERRLDDLMGAMAETETGAQAARAFLVDQREALSAMDDLRLAIIREVSGTAC